MLASYGFRRPNQLWIWDCGMRIEKESAIFNPHSAMGMGLWSGLYLRFTRSPSSLSTFLKTSRLGSGLPYCFRNLGFPEFDEFYKQT